eukprot:s646_g25.t1
MLPALLEAKLVRQPLAPDFELRARLQGTIWEPGRLDNFPDLLDGAQLATQMRLMFSPVTIDEVIWTDVARRLNCCQLSKLQAYASWRRLRGEDWRTLGPTPIFRRMRAKIYAGLTGQRHAPDTSRGLDHLLPPGLGPEAHIGEALRLPSPFTHEAWPEPDVEFVLDAIWIWRQHLPTVAHQQRTIVRSVHRALQPVRLALQSHRSQSALMVAKDKDPAFVACLTALLRWPDLQQPRHLLQGYPIVGPVPPCGVFRAVHQGSKSDPDEWMGTPAEDDLHRLLASKPPLFAADILEVTQAEMTKGFSGPLRSKMDLDKEFGPGEWRFLERFLIVQPDGKKRVIDNGRKSGHNQHTQMQETISTVSVDFVASVARMMCDRIAEPLETWDQVHPWLSLRLGTDDLPDAYRGLPVADDHLRLALPSPDVACWAAALLTLMMLSVEFFKDVCVTQRGLTLTFTLMGAPPQPAKSFSPSFDRHYLGTSVHVGDAFTLGVVRFQPKTATQWKVLARLHDAYSKASLDRDTAGKLRGDLNWMWSMCAGHIGRLAGPLLFDKQRSDDPKLDSVQLHTLALLIDIVRSAPPRDVPVAGPTPPLVVVYSDASFEQGILRLGWVIYTHAHRPVGGTCVVPAATLASWRHRRQQIFPGEALAALVTMALYPHPRTFCGSSTMKQRWPVLSEPAVLNLTFTSFACSHMRGFFDMVVACGMSGSTVPVTFGWIKNDWSTALDVLLALRRGSLPPLLDFPHATTPRQKAVESRITQVIQSYLVNTLRPDAARFQVRQICFTAINVCIEAELWPVLYKTVFECFKATGHMNVYCTALEPFIVHGRIPRKEMDSEVLSSILQSYALPLEEEEQASQQASKDGSNILFRDLDHCPNLFPVARRLQQLVLCVDVSRLDLNLAIRLFTQHRLWTALVHVYCALGDFVSPLELLVGECTQLAKRCSSGDLPEEAPLLQCLLVRKLFFFIYRCFELRAFPLEPKDALGLVQPGPNAIVDLLACIFKTSDPSKAPPMFLRLLRLSSLGFFNTLSALFTSPSASRAMQDQAAAGKISWWKDTQQGSLLKALFELIQSSLEAAKTQSAEEGNPLPAHAEKEFLWFVAKSLPRARAQLPIQKVMQVVDHVLSCSQGRQRKVEQLLIGVLSNQDSFDDEHSAAVINKAMNGFWGLASWLHERSGEYGKALDCRLQDPELREQIFEYIIAKLAEELNPALIEATLHRLQALVEVDNELCSLMLCEQFANVPDHSTVLDSLKPYPQMEMRYLEALLLRWTGAADRQAFFNMHVVRYIDLLCQHCPSAVLPFILENEALPLRECLELCGRYRVTDASVHLLERTGDFASVLHCDLHVGVSCRKRLAKEGLSTKIPLGP